MINLMCVMHQCKPYGHLAINGKPMDMKTVWKMVRIQDKRRMEWVRELDENGVIQRTEKGVLYHPRMVKDEHIRSVRSEAGKKGCQVFAQAKSKQMVEDEDEVEEEVKYNKKKVVKKKEYVPHEKKDKRNKDIDLMLTALKQTINIEAFVDSAIERNMAKHCLSLIEKIGSEEFKRRLEGLLEDDFQSKNCNKIRYVYNNIKGWKDPVIISNTVRI